MWSVRLPVTQRLSSMTARLGACLMAMVIGACSGGESSERDSAPALNDPARMPGDPVDLTLHAVEDQPLAGVFDVVQGEDLDRDPAYSVFSPPSHGDVRVLGQGPEFIYTPDADYFGTDAFTYEAGTGRPAAVTLDIAAVNDAPRLIDNLPRVIEQGRLYTASLLASDVDGDALVYAGINVPGWLSLDTRTGQLHGTPTQLDTGIWRDIGFRVSDPQGLDAVIDGIAIEVLDINDAPRLNISRIPARFDARQRVVAELHPNDPDGDAVTITVERNDYMQASVSGGTVTLTAADVQAVTAINLVLIARDRLGRIAREIVPVTIFPLTASGQGRTIYGSQSGVGVHLVVLGDGYREDQQAAFRAHVENMIAVMRSDPGVNRHFSAWNVHMIESISSDSGIDDDIAFDSRDTAFDAGYFCQSIRRLICADQLKLYDAALGEYPGLDQIVLLVNDSRYGGSGGSVAIAVANAPEIALHEMGHSIAGLADEYVDNLIPEVHFPAFEEGRFANVSRLNDPERVPWAHWIDPGLSLPSLAGDSGVGLFEGAFFREQGYYRPTFDSRMRSLYAPLGPVNSEQWVLSIYRMSNPVQDFQPRRIDVDLAIGQSQEFSVVPLLDGEVQQINWYLNGNPIGDSRREITLTPVAGEHVLEVEVADISGLIRRETPHPGYFLWRWNVDVR